jgi:HSP90 family molecular chaperone
MTDKLYGKEHLCIRELLQNSLDALRHRRALFREVGTDWGEGRVDFTHYIDSNGYEVLQCFDNGSGMDEFIIRNHFVRVGRSYYRSPTL